MKPLHSSPSLVTKPLWNMFQFLTSWLINKIMGGFASPLRAGLAIYLLTSCHYIRLMLVTTCTCKVKQQLNGL